MRMHGAILFAIIYFISPLSVFASVSAPTLNTSQWETGGFTVSYNATAGGTINLFLSTDNQNFSDYISFPASSSGTYDVTGLQNGTTYYFYLTESMPDGSVSPPSALYKQTPPYTVFIVNWPDMLKDLNNMLDSFFTPSQSAVNNLNSAVSNLESASGAGSAVSAGSSLQNAMNGVATSGNGISSPESGDLAFDITIVNSQWGNVVAHLFTSDELQKLTWLSTVRTVLQAVMWITFVVWLVVRFTPMFKV